MPGTSLGSLSFFLFPKCQPASYGRNDPCNLLEGASFDLPEGFRLGF